MASKEEKESSDAKRSSPMGQYQHDGGGAAPGKILSPLASRMPYPPYIKHELSKPDIYRNFNGPHGAVAHHMAGVGHPDYSLLESYQRALVAHNGLSAAMHPLTSIMSAKSAAEQANPTGSIAFAPLSLTTGHPAQHSHHQQQHHPHHHHQHSVPSSGASPSASSTSSRLENSTPVAAVLSATAHDSRPAPTTIDSAP